MNYVFDGLFAKHLGVISFRTSILTVILRLTLEEPLAA